MSSKQSSLFRGIYEFEDPSGSLLAAKVPSVGSVDLYADTAVIVRPTQVALFIYKGEIADILKPGTHRIQTENLPVLSKLANWKFGFKNPLRCELIFVSTQLMTGRRWGTTQPFLIQVPGHGPVPLRSYGNFNIEISDAKKFFLKLMGSRSVFNVMELEEFVQAQILEVLPSAFQGVASLTSLSAQYNELSRKVESLLKKELSEFGLSCPKLQLLSALPSKEILQALDAKTAIQIIGSQKEYLLYKAANSLEEGKAVGGNDPMQMMIGMMLGKGLIGADFHNKEERTAIEARVACGDCGHKLEASSSFCSKCGKRLAS